MTHETKIVFPASERGHQDLGWLDTHHSFSFGPYHNPQMMGFGALRVLNDDTVTGGHGFDPHIHQNMEIITIPLAGALVHADSTGQEQSIHPGEVQVMSAGIGIKHSEYNAFRDREVRFLQIWIIPAEVGVEPRYDHRLVELTANFPTTVVGPQDSSSPLWIHQHAWISLLKLEAGRTTHYTSHREGNGAFTFMIEGQAIVEGELLQRRDALGIVSPSTIEITAQSEVFAMIIDVPMIHR